MNLKLNQYFMLIGFLFLSLVKTHATATPAQLADSARLAYEKQQYKKAIQYYENILSVNYNSSLLHYNLGNAYYRDNQLGKAIYHFELAKKINPSDEDINNNLRIAASKTIDKIDIKENFFVNSIKSNLLTLFTTSGWAWFSILFLFLSILFFVIYVLSAGVIPKRTGFWAGLAFMLISLSSLVVGYSALSNKTKINQAIVTLSQIQVVNIPGNNGKPLFSLHEGTKVRVMETNKEWTSIQLDNGNEGWVKTNEIGLF